MSKYEEMSDAQIDYLVKGIKYGHNDKDINRLFYSGQMSFCRNPNDAWPIIVDNEIGVSPHGEKWMANNFNPSSAGSYQVQAMSYHTNPLRSAMIVFLMMKDSERCN